MKYQKDIRHLSVLYLSVHFCYSNITDYLTLYTFSFEIKESTLFDPKRLIHDVVSSSPRCSDKRMGTMHDIFTVELFCCDIISLECGGKQRK